MMQQSSTFAPLLTGRMSIQTLSEHFFKLLKKFKNNEFHQVKRFQTR